MISHYTIQFDQITDNKNLFYFLMFQYQTVFAIELVYSLNYTYDAFGNMLYAFPCLFIEMNSFYVGDYIEWLIYGTKLYKNDIFFNHTSYTLGLVGTLLYHYFIKDHGSWWSKHYEPIEDPDLYMVAILIFGAVSVYEIWFYENPFAEDHHDGSESLGSEY